MKTATPGSACIVLSENTNGLHFYNTLPWLIMQAQSNLVKDLHAYASKVGRIVPHFIQLDPRIFPAISFPISADLRPANAPGAGNTLTFTRIGLKNPFHLRTLDFRQMEDQKSMRQH